jgi:PKD repeat protein
MKHHRVLFVFLVVLAIISLCSGIVAGEQDDYYEFVGGWGAEDFHPYGVAVARYLVVTSHPSEKPIYVFDTSGNFVESWGVNGNAEGNVHPGSFDRPYGVDADPNGEYYFADTYNHRVQRWGKNFEYIVGGIWSYWMHPNTLPKDIAAGETEVYVTDPANNLVAASDKNGGYHRAFYSGGDIGFLNPTGVAINPNNQDFFVVDSGNNCIHRFDNEDVFILQWGSEGSGNGQFHNPTGITVDKYGHVYVVDSGNNRIQVFDTEGRYITQWGSKGSGNGQFSSPYDIAVQPMGPDTERAMVYVSDTGNNRIQIFKQTEYLQALLADFSILEMGLEAPMEVIFLDNSAGDPEYWFWDFDDGKPVSEQNPHHVYEIPGTYTVTLRIMKVVGGQVMSSTISKQIVVTGSQVPGQGLQAGFTAAPLIGEAPLKVTFTDTSTGDPQFWNYNFGDGRSDSSKNPVHTYSSPGNYTVTLTVRRLEDGQMVKNTAEKQIVVTCGQVPGQGLQAGFTTAPLAGDTSLKVAFTDNSTGDPQFWSYNFGDGRSDSSKNPVHTYSAPGNYTVTLTVMKLGNGQMIKNTAEKQIVVTGGPGPAPQFQAGFTADPVTGKAPLKVAFTDTSSGDPKFWNYNFGDGTSGSSKNPVHTYLTPGNYTVTLSVMKVEKGTLVKNSTVNLALIMVT